MTGAGPTLPPLQARKHLPHTTRLAGIQGGSALEAQFLVLGGDIIPEELQCLAHGALCIGTEVPGVLALQDLDNGL